MNTRFRKALVAVGVAALTMTAAPSAAATGSTTLHACVDKDSGAMRLVSGSKKCKQGEFKVSWNTSGRDGVAGPTGASGPTGAPGAVGAAGAVGATGAAGASGASGPAGPAGPAGPIGPSDGFLFGGGAPASPGTSGRTEVKNTGALGAGSYIAYATGVFRADATEGGVVDVNCLFTRGGSEVGAQGWVTLDPADALPPIGSLSITWGFGNLAEGTVIGLACGTSATKPVTTVNAVITLVKVGSLTETFG